MVSGLAGGRGGACRMRRGRGPDPFRGGAPNAMIYRRT